MCLSRPVIVVCGSVVLMAGDLCSHHGSVLIACVLSKVMQMRGRRDVMMSVGARVKVQDVCTSMSSY